MFSLQTIRWADLLRIRIDCYNLASVLKTFVYKEGYIHLYLHVYLYTYNLIIVKVPLDVNVFFLLWKASVGSFKNICKTKANIIPCSLTVHPFVFFFYLKKTFWFAQIEMMFKSLSFILKSQLYEGQSKLR